MYRSRRTFPVSPPTQAVASRPPTRPPPSPLRPPPGGGPPAKPAKALSTSQRPFIASLVRRPAVLQTAQSYAGRPRCQVLPPPSSRFRPPAPDSFVLLPPATDCSRAASCQLTASSPATSPFH